MNVSLPPALEDYVRRKVATGQYDSASGRSSESAASPRRSAARPDSDIDVLIDIDPTADFDLFDLVGVRNLIGDRLGHKIDLVEKASLKPRFRDDIAAEAETAF